MLKEVYISIGSNMGDKKKYIEDSISLMEEYGIFPKKLSSFYQTKAYGLTEQDDFLNAICLAETELEPRALLHSLNDIERRLDRVRVVRWGPRTIDLDIIFYGDEIVFESDLIIPHVDMKNRRFVLEPLAEINEKKLHPVFEKTVLDMLRELELEEEKAWLEEIGFFGMKLGLSNTRRLLEKLGNPEKKLRCIHVAGTNGKGSTCTYISSILEQSGLRVGLFTSPFIESFNERFKINNSNIEDLKLLDIFKKVHKAVDEIFEEGSNPTYFEIVTVMCFLYFMQEEVDIAVIEVGLGGLYDATNVIENPLASFITTISYDHTDILGNTKEEIALQKAGIIKKEAPVFCYPNEESVMEVFKKTAEEKKSPFFELNKKDIEVKEISAGNTVFSYRDFKNLTISMWGEHQVMNASLAIFGLLTLREMKKLNFSDKALYDGLRLAKIIGRLEIISTKPYFMIDGAHNIEGITVLKKALKNIKYKRLILGMAILRDKDYKKMLKEIIPLADEVIVTGLNMERSLSSEELYEEVVKLNDRATEIKDIMNAIKLSYELAEKDDLILWCGSLYLVGIVRKYETNKIY